jgi:PAS domain S-box-containing protein
MLDCFGIYSAIRDRGGNIVDFKIEYLNSAALASNCMTPEHIGQRLCELLPAYRENGLFLESCQVVETGKPLIKEAAIYSDVFEGQKITRAYDIWISKWNDGFVAAWRDVTERKKAEEKLDDSLKFIRRILDSTPSLVYIYDLIQRRNIYLNNRVEEVLGYSKAQLEGKSFDVLFPNIHPEDLAKLPQRFAQINATAEGEASSFEYRYRHRDGQWRWLCNNSTVFSRTPEGLAKQIIGTTHDITALKVAGKKRRKIRGSIAFV